MNEFKKYADDCRLMLANTKDPMIQKHLREMIEAWGSIGQRTSQREPQEGSQ